MLTRKQVLTLAIASTLITEVARGGRAEAAGLSQRQWDGQSPPQAGACFFEDVNFGGRYFCVRPGEELAQVPQGMNDAISSFRIIGDVEVTVFKDYRFEGESGRFSTDARDLRRNGWNDTISSVRVTSPFRVRDGIRGAGRDGGWNGIGDGVRGDRFPEWGRRELPREGACFYKDVNFEGEYFCLPRGASYGRLPAGFEDQISSIRLIRATSVRITVDRDFRGENANLTSDLPDLRRRGWNDTISSIRVY